MICNQKQSVVLNSVDCSLLCSPKTRRSCVPYTLYASMHTIVHTFITLCKHTLMSMHTAAFPFKLLGSLALTSVLAPVAVDLPSVSFVAECAQFYYGRLAKMKCCQLCLRAGSKWRVGKARSGTDVRVAHRAGCARRNWRGLRRPGYGFARGRLCVPVRVYRQHTTEHV